MSPSLALFITLVFVAWLFRRDFREKPNVTSALWLPFFWVFINGSRFVSQWLDIFGIQLGGSSTLEGTPIDAVSFFGLIGAGVYVLYQRRGSFAAFIRNNPWFKIYLAYCFLAILWSDNPFVALKRWIKLFGQPVMVLIVLTEPDPMESLTRLLKRCAYVLIPISILFIRYYAELGRGYDNWTGGAMYTGVTLNKNSLGCDCMILGFFFFWHFSRVSQRERRVFRRNELILCLGCFAMIGWLFHMANSSTSLGSLLVAVGLVWFLDRKSTRLNSSH